MKIIKLDLKGTRVWQVFRDGEVLGYLGLDSSIGGRSCGGLRYLENLDAEEIAGLARAMTLKYGFLGIPQGGAKAGIVCIPGESESARNQKLLDFGKAIAPWLRNNSYFPGTDMGITIDDLNTILKSAGIRLKPWKLGCRYSGVYTAVTVFAGIIAVCKSKNKQIDKCTFAIEGFGSVGSALASFIHDAGGRITAVSTRHGAVYNQQGLDIPLLLERTSRGEENLFSSLAEARRISNEELRLLPVDIFSPCARHNSITSKNAGSIMAWAIVPGANNPVTTEAEKIMTARHIICLPDFVANAGGVLGGTMFFAGIGHMRIIRFITDNFQPVYTDLFRGSQKHGISMREHAESLARQRHKKVKNTSENLTLPSRVFKLGLSMYRSGLIPRSLMGRISMGYFKNLPVFKGS